MSATRSRGFSLVEVLVALLVFSAVASMSVYTLRLSIDAREQLSRVQDDVRAIDLMRIAVKQDLLQMAARPVRDEFGARNPFYFYGGAGHPRSAIADDERLLFSFVRDGWINPAYDAPRSSLQFVQYIEKNKKLIRRVRPYLDDARGQGATDRVLIENEGALEVEFLRDIVRGELSWVSDWPAGSTVAAPTALKVTIGADGSAPVEMLFYIGEIVS